MNQQHTINNWQQVFEHYLSTHPATDHSHHVDHFQRVYATAQAIMRELGGDQRVVVAACYFHDIVNLPKNHPDRSQSSRLAADKTIEILTTHFPQFPSSCHAGVHHAICAHSYSGGIRPQTLEAQIVQDADRIEALGAIGLARVFYVAGKLGHTLFDSEDLLAEQRPVDDQHYALDHFQQKLLKLPATMNTSTGKKIARHNANFLVQFMAKLAHEIKGEHFTLDQSVLERFSV